MARAGVVKDRFAGGFIVDDGVEDASLEPMLVDGTLAGVSIKFINIIETYKKEEPDTGVSERKGLERLKERDKRTVAKRKKRK